MVPTLDFGGVESVVVAHAAEARRRGIDLRVCTFWRDGEAARQIRALGIQVDVLGVSPSPRGLAAHRALRGYLASRPMDVLHAAIFEANVVAALSGLRSSRRPALVTEEVGIPYERSGMARLLSALSHRRADLTIGVANASLRYLRERERVPSEALELVYNCVPGRWFDPDNRVELRTRCRRVVTVGRLVPEKDHILLVEAFARVLREHEEARLEIIGEGPLRAALERRVRELGVGHAIRLPGFQSDPRVALMRSDLFVLPSKQEGLPLALVEALAVGLPALGSDAGGIPEVFEGSLSGRVIPSGSVDAWAAALLDELDSTRGERAATVMKQHAATEKFRPEAYVNRLERIYIEALRRRGS